MKKFGAYLAAIIICTSFTSCQSKEKKVYAENEIILQNAIQLAERKEYQQSIKLLDAISDHPSAADALILVKEDAYALAVNEYNRGEFDKSQQLFETIDPYKDSSAYLENVLLLKLFQGTWKSDSIAQSVVFYGWTVTRSNASGNLTKTYSREDVDKLRTENGATYYIHDTGMLYEKINSHVGKPIENVYYKKNDSTEIPATSPKPTKVPKREPSIGMTAQEVRDSTWGSPEDVNRTTNAYGVHEQWVYSGNRYVYLDDGIVTTIQD